jgi:ABC-2 type transport system permease protein
MWPVLLRHIKDNRNSLLIYSIFAILMTWLYVAMFPSIAKQSAQFTEMLKNYPEGFMKAFGIDSAQLTFSSLESFLAMENYNFMWPIMAIALTVSLASNAIAGEIEKSTIILLLSQPISRIKLFFAKYFSALFNLSVFTIFSVLCSIPLAKLHHIEFISKNYLFMALLAFTFGLAVYSLAIFFSSLFSEKGKVVFFTVGIMVLMYAIKIISSLKDNLSDLKYLSFFYYFDQDSFLVKGHFEALNIAVFLTTALFFTIAACLIFQKRDIAA